MKPVFADTFYFLALLNRTDRHHTQAVQFQAEGRKLITTAWILVEVADALCSVATRLSFVRLFEALSTVPNSEIIGATQAYFDLGTELYRRRADKDWSLTDCISFEAMRQMQITEALTGDHHFVQAGYRALFL